MAFHVPERFRVVLGRRATSAAHGNNGGFLVKPSKNARPLCVVASDGGGWEHVSVSLPDRLPTWAEMCRIKELFWDAEDAVMQLHSPKSQWVNDHNNCLHLWRPTNGVIPLPPKEYV